MSYPCGVCDLETEKTKCVLCRECSVWYHADHRTLASELNNDQNKK